MARKLCWLSSFLPRTTVNRSLLRRVADRRRAPQVWRGGRYGDVILVGGMIEPMEERFGRIWVVLRDVLPSEGDVFGGEESWRGRRVGEGLGDQIMGEWRLL